MRVAVCAPGMEEHYALASLAEKTLLQRGMLPVVSLFPLLAELAQSAAAEGEFSLVLLANVRDGPAVRSLCRVSPVVLVGSPEDGPAAFDMGAGYFIESPVDQEKLEKALARCLWSDEDGAC